MLIGLNFGDNDFGYAITPWMRDLKESIKQGLLPIENINEELIANLFNESIYGYYILNQNLLQYNKGDNIKNYLTINKDDVFLDKDLLEKLKTATSWSNYAFWYFDTEDERVGIICI